MLFFFFVRKNSEYDELGLIIDLKNIIYYRY